MIEEEKIFNENVEKIEETNKLQITKNIEDLDDLKGIEGLKEVEESDENDDNCRPLSNHLFNTQLDKSLTQYKDTEIAELDSGFCLSRGYLTPTLSTSVTHKCAENTDYVGYISKIKAREISVNGNTIYKIRVVCHLIIEDEVAEFFAEYPSTISPTSNFAILLIKMGIPVFDIDSNHFDLDKCLKHRNITATLKKITNPKNNRVYFFIDKINPRSV